MRLRPKVCQHCGDIRIIEFFGDGSPEDQYRIGCTCGHADFVSEWCNTRAEAIRRWNKIADQW